MKILVAETGSALLEFSLMLPLIILMLAGIVDLGFAIQQAIIVSDAAHAGTLYASLPGKGEDKIGMKTAATAAGLPSFNQPVPVNWCSCSLGGAELTCPITCTTGSPLEYAQVTTSTSTPILMAYSKLTTNFPATLTGFSAVRIK